VIAHTRRASARRGIAHASLRRAQHIPPQQQQLNAERVKKANADIDAALKRWAEEDKK
jgi:hypothetical protein